MTSTTKTYGCLTKPVINNVINALLPQLHPFNLAIQTNAYILPNSSHTQNVRQFFSIKKLTNTIIMPPNVPYDQR